MTPPDSAGPSGSPWSDLGRPPLNAAALRRALVRPDALWTSIDVVPVTGSTNTDLATLAGEGAGLAPGAVLVAEEQSAGRGRLDRRWSAPARSGIFFSVYLEPGDEVPMERWGWLPLLAGVATATALSRAAGVDMALKWPNDLLVTVPEDADGSAGRSAGPAVGDSGGSGDFGDSGGPGGSRRGTAVSAERKTGGILAERAGAGVVLGIGLNVSLRADELPVPTAGSLLLAGAPVVDRDPLLRAVLRSLEEWYGQWRATGGDPGACRLQEAYTAGCATLGRTVRAELPGDRALVGEAVAIDGDGRLVLATAEGVQEPVGAGDIVHLRPAEG
ncbi:biotin--[acetyl-CoA-carboxylase] ligase [Streptomyces sp. NPDC050610]|uniref:biotin--[acetyl-CoA-carboxylase] ligase n=1 Tax=Streptomyces sp. NPDC050610 TaxID=3157097 RepID=UPI00341A0519